MQGNKIVIATGLSGITDDCPDMTLTRSEETVNRTTYTLAETHTLASRDIVQLYRTYPKRAGASRGSSKCAIKVTTDISVPNADGSGDIVLPLIGEASFSLPVGVTDAQLVILRAKIAKLLIAPALVDWVSGDPGVLSPIGASLLSKLNI